MYTTIAELEAYMGTDFDSATETLLTNQILPAMKALIDQYTQRTFEASADTTRYLHAVRDVGYGDGMWIGNDFLEHSEVLRTLWLDKDLCAITTITNGDGVVVTSSQYTTIPRNETPYSRILLKASENVAWTYNDDPEAAITIVGRWAYSTTPPDVISKIAAPRWSKFLYRQRDSDRSGSDEPKMTDAGVWVYPTSIPADIKMMLEPLRRRI